jgi:hypothetical protein
MTLYKMSRDSLSFFVLSNFLDPAIHSPQLHALLI